MAPKVKEKPKPSAASSPTVSIEDLFTSLKAHIDKSEYEQTVKIADQVLKIAPGDEDALRCKIVSLISDDKFDKALSTIQSAQKAPNDFGFYKAYCLYRQNSLNEALESLKTQEQTSSTMLLESQILFRLGRMDACMDVFQKLQKFKIDSLEINIVAGLVTAGRASEVQTTNSLKVNKNSSFELVYNTACSLIEVGKYTEAEEHLLSARRNGTEQLMGDWDNEEIEIELAPIAVQLGYVHQVLGHTQEATEAYLDITKKNVADELSLAVAINNLIAIKGPKDASDGLRKLDRLIEKSDEGLGIRFTDNLDVKLTSKQKEAICFNRVLLLLQGNKIDQARDLVAALPKMFPTSISPVLLQAAVLVRENKPSKAEEILGQFADKFPEKSKQILLTRATIAATAGHSQIAADSLLRIPDIQHYPSTVATIVTLKERTNDIEGAIKVFDAAIHFWSNTMDEGENNDNVNIITQEAAAFMVKHGREEEAAKLYEDLVKSGGNGNLEALVGLVGTVARVDVDKAEMYAKKLKPLPGLKGVDVESLEKSSGAEYVEVKEIDVMGEDKGKKIKKKRKRKPRYPKGFDPANPGPGPDPERWLPKRERSSYRPKRKDKRAAQVRGAQGSVSKEEVENAVKVEQPSTSKPEPPKGAAKSRKKSRK